MQRILQNFVEQFGHELTETSMLIVPNGRVWQVQLKRKGQKILLHWKNLSFRVHVFDLIGYKIEYPYDGAEPIDDE